MPSVHVSSKVPEPLSHAELTLSDGSSMRIDATKAGDLPGGRENDLAMIDAVLIVGHTRDGRRKIIKDRFGIGIV